MKTLDPRRTHLHGSLSGDREPVLRVEPGETISLRTPDVGWGLEPPTSATAPRAKVEDPEDGPALVGPVAVEGAEPGMTLEVRLDRIRPGSWGWTYSGAEVSPLNTPLGVEAPLELVTWELDAEEGIARSRVGSVRMAPFLGIVGVAPEPGPAHSGWLPFRGGGNLDCKALTEGSSLFLPVLAPGGLLSVGDGHAAQGDGEVGGMAIECPMDEVRLTLDLHDHAIAGPIARTGDAWITFGLSQDLDRAVIEAVNHMLDLIMDRRGLSRPDAMVLASASADVRISQLVNGVRGVHVVLPDRGGE